MIPENLVNRLGPPRKEGGLDSWTVWDAGTGRSNDVILWKPGLRWAVNKATGQRIFAGDPGAWQESWRPEPEQPKLEWQPCTGAVRDYAFSRGLTPEEIDEHCAIHPDWPNHLAFPITEDGRLVAWQARSIDETWKPKYTSGKTSDGWMPAHQTLWGLDRLYPDQPAFLCEGIFDALYFPTGVAYLGSQLHETQIVKVLDRLPSYLALCLDRDTVEDFGAYRRLVNAINRVQRFALRRVLIPHVDRTPVKDFGTAVGLGKRCSEKYLDDLGNPV